MISIRFLCDSCPAVETTRAGSLATAHPPFGWEDWGSVQTCPACIAARKPAETKARMRLGWKRRPTICPVCEVLVGKRAVWLTPPERNEATKTETAGVAVHPDCLPSAVAAARHAEALARKAAKTKAGEPSPTGSGTLGPQIAASDAEAQAPA